MSINALPIAGIYGLTILKTFGPPMLQYTKVGPNHMQTGDPLVGTDIPEKSGINASDPNCDLLEQGIFLDKCLHHMFVVGYQGNTCRHVFRLFYP